MYRINHANIKEWAANYQGELFDGILCDPPYEIGFMSRAWDSSGIAFDTEMWSDIYKLLKPGAHLLAFSGSRTYHRMAVAIEDAGFEIRDMIEWVYGSGFPKSLNIGKAVDKIQGNEREVLGSYYGAVQNPNSVAGGLNASPNADENGRTTVIQTKGTSEWEGYGTALKPAHEPCVLARKPLEKGHSVATNVLKHGTGGLNIDGTRVGTTEAIASHNGTGGGNGHTTGKFNDNYKSGDAGKYTQTLGRFPANLIHDGSDEVEAVFPQTKSGAMNSIAKPNQYNTYGKMYERQVTNSASSGSASRFFYTAKASKRERNAGLEGFEERDSNYRTEYRPTANDSGDKGQDTPFAGSNRSGNVQNHHPTVKPLSLTKYLATLIKPPTGGRLLVPFSGSGSEMIGALQAGWEYVEGVELTEEYIPIAEARIKYWLAQKEEDTKQLELV